MNIESETTLESVEAGELNPDEVVHYVCVQCQPIAFCGWDTTGEEQKDSYDARDTCVMCVMEMEKGTRFGIYICKNGHVLKVK